MNDVMSIHTDQATLDRWLADGRWVEFAPGRYVYDDGSMEQVPTRPPDDWKPVPCETCGGLGCTCVKFCERADDHQCLVCNGSGVQRLAVTVPCEHDESTWDEDTGYGCCGDTGRITIPGVTATVEWGPTCIVRDHEMMSGDFLFVGGDNCLHGLIDNREVHTGSLPPDVDWQSLVGQWARGGTIEAT